MTNPYVEKIKAEPNLTRLLNGGRWKGMHNAMLKAVEGGEPGKVIPFEQAKRPRD